MYYIYKMLNIHNSKFYIGKTENYEKRIRQHLNNIRLKNHPNFSINQDININNYNQNDFVCKILRILDSEEDAIFFEEYFINKDYTKNYNIAKKSTGGYDLISYHPNHENICKDKKQKAIDFYNSERSLEVRKKTSERMASSNNIMYGKHHTLSARIKMSEARKGSSNPNKGKKLEEYVGEERAKELKKYFSEVAKKRIGPKNSFYGRHHSEETKEKLRKIHTGKQNKSCWKKVSIDGVVYNNLQEASLALNIPVSTISWRVRKSKKHDNYFYL